jgi:hypothetical protein
MSFVASADGEILKVSGRGEYGRGVGSAEEHVQETLLRRAQQAVDAASEIVARSQAITLASTGRRTGSLTCRCAWCGRYRMGRNHWFLVEPSSTLDWTDTTQSAKSASRLSKRLA